MSSRRAGAWQDQPGQVLARKQSDERCHAQRQWDDRVASKADRPDLVGLDVRAAWAESEPIASGVSYCMRRHPSGMVLVSEWGCIQTAFYGGDEEDSYRDNQFMEARS